MTIRKHGSALTLRDRLSQLSFPEACKLLGSRGTALIRRGGALEVHVAEQVALDAERFVLRIPRSRGPEVVLRM